jgi:hypothetical protein
MTGTHRRKSPAKAIWAVAATAALALGIAGTAAFASDGPGGDHSDHPGIHGQFRHAADLNQLTANPDCTLKVPADPLSAEGLSTPYVLHSAGMTCSEANEGTAAFVQATILDPSTGHVFVYNPVVENPGDNKTAPAVTLPHGAVVTIWTGFNANVLKLVGPGQDGFVNFAQQAYDNSPQFYAALNRSGIVPLAPGTATDGMMCPTTRDWSVVDQDQSDNVPVTSVYGTTNGSDENLIQWINRALGCIGSEWQAPDLVTGIMEPDGALQEAQAAKWQQNPALVPALDPFVTINGKPNLFLQNLYRAQVDQPASMGGNDTPAYCANLAKYGAVRLKAEAGLDGAIAAPPFTDPNMTLAQVLEGRFAMTWGNLQCGGPSPYLTRVTAARRPSGGIITWEGAGGAALERVPCRENPGTVPPHRSRQLALWTSTGKEPGFSSEVGG